MDEQLGRTLGKRVATLRRSRGLNQGDLADLAATTLDTIGRLERGASLPGVSKLAQIADALGVPLWQLFYPSDTADAGAGLATEMAYLVAGCDPPRIEVIRDVVARIARG